MITPEELNDYTVTETGDLIPEDQAQRILEVIEPAVSNGSYVESDGSLWWVFNTSTGYQDGDDFKSASVGGIVEFGLATSSIANVWPLGADMATYDVSEADDDIKSVSALTQADLRMLAGQLWIMDLREDAPLRVLDPATGELTAIVIAKGDGVDSTAATLISSDPESMWLEVVRSTITSEEGEPRSAQGAKFLDQVAPPRRHSRPQ